MIVPTKHTDQDEHQLGFALVIALTLMSFVLVLILSITILVGVETRNSSQSRSRLLARENARLGAMIALGNLQKVAGLDQQVTARAEVDVTSELVTRMWSGVYDASSGVTSAPTWLVSGKNPTPAIEPAAELAQTIFPATSTTDAVVVEKQPIRGLNNQTNSFFAYWTEEQNVKARINRSNETGFMDYLTNPGDQQDIAESFLLFPAQDKVLTELQGPRLGGGGNEPIASADVDILAKMRRERQLGLVFSSGFDYQETINRRRNDFSLVSMSVLENPELGGLKTNLTGRTRSQLDILLGKAYFTEDTYLAGDYLEFFNVNPLTGNAYPNTANANNPSMTGSSFTSNSELVRIPPKDFYTYRSSSINDSDGDVETIRTIMPIISEVSFQLGAFHTQSDAKHRLRFHASAEFWNPYPFPIRMPAESQSRSFIIMLLPSELGEPDESGATPEQIILSIQKIGAGVGRGGGAAEEEIHTNLFNFDETLRNEFDSRSFNTINESVITSWMTIDDLVLQPGEVYHASTENVNSAGINVGLARDLGGYVLEAGGDSEKAEDYTIDPTHDYNKWSWQTGGKNGYPILQPDDEIQVNLRMPASGLTFRMIAFDPRSTSNSSVFEDNTDNLWATPIWELRNIYVGDNPPPMTLRGDEYSRSSSGSYTINNFNIGFHFRLADELITGSDPDATDLALRFDLRQPVWDFENEAVQQLVDVTEENPFAVSQIANLHDGTDVITNGNKDTHTGTLERVFLYNSPIRQPLSVGALHRLPLTYETVDYDANYDGLDDKVQLRIGMPWGDELNEAFDKYFYTGAPDIGWDLGKPLPVSALLPRSDATRDQILGSDAASNLLFQGGFNVNSISQAAWEAMLSNTLHNWQDGNNPALDLKNAFTNLGDSTDLAIESNGILEDETALSAFDPANPEAAERAGRLAMRQPLRRLTDSQISEFAQSLVLGIQAYIASNTPFASIKDFVNSAVLEQAILDSNINNDIATFSTAYISQNLVLEMLAPYLTVRSDTFVIHSIGTVESFVVGGTPITVRCEMLVQRIPNRIDQDNARIADLASSNGNRFGRKFTIINFNWSTDGI